MGAANRLVRPLLAALLVWALSTGAVWATYSADSKWVYTPGNGYDHWITYKTFGFPTDAWRSRISDGRTQWNNTGRELWFSWTQGASYIVNVDYQDMWWTSALAEAFADDIFCGDICGGFIKFNLNYTWYAGTGTPPSGQYDAWSVAADEFGHLVELLDLYAGGESEHTMYGYTSPTETKKRSLDTHDIQGIQYLYPAN